MPGPPDPRSAVVVVGGDPPDPDALQWLPPGVRVIAADRGLDHALDLGLAVDLAVGDFDSAGAPAQRAAAAAGTRFERHRSAKEATDLALALDAALAGGAEEIVVVGGAGGRLDHLFGTALLLAAPAYASVRIRAHLGRARVWVVRDHAELTGPVGAYVSLLPVHGPAGPVTTTGLRYPLTAEELPAGTSRGVSNEFARERAEIRVGRGVLLVVAPDPDRD